MSETQTPDNKTLDGAPVKEKQEVKWVFPEKVRKDLLEGSEAVLNKITDTEPEGIVALERKGRIACAGVEALAKKKGIKLPPKVNLRVFPPEDYPGEYATEDETEAFVERIKQESTQPNTPTYRSLNTVKEDVGLLNTIKVMIVDDFKFEGTTSETAKAILKLPEALGPDAEISEGYVFANNNGWHTALLRETFDLTEAKYGDEVGIVTELLKNLMTGEVEAGSYVYEETEKLSTWSDVRKLGERLLEKSKAQNAEAQNPADILENYYTKESLLTLSESLDKAIRSQFE